MKLGISFALVMALSACVEEGAVEPLPDLESTSESIIGGIEDSSSPSVVLSRHGAGECTGTLIGRRVILTAAHCIVDDIEAGGNSATIFFGDGGAAGFDSNQRVQHLAMHRYFDLAQVQQYDIGMMRLREDAPAEIPVMPFNLEPLPESTMGATVRTVGFGVTNGETQTGAGTKRSAFFTVNSLTSVHIGLGDETKNICQGDSGGPTLMDIGGTETVVAVSSFGSNFCMNESKVVRTDAYRDWMIEVYDAWDGPCQFDGECVTEGCRTPDPDCDSCGFDGFCATGCDKLDLDCPIVGFATDLCSNNDGCESRVCVEGLDDPRVKYCSESCETAGDCPAPLSICEDGACYVSGPSPGAQGDDCTAGSDCRSGACDPDHSICIEQCGDGLPECPDPYSCVKVGGVKACSIGSEGGCAVAAAGRTGAAGFAWLLAAFAALVAVRRRRR